MRFVVLIKSNPGMEAGILPDEELRAEMGTFNEELTRAGVLLAAEGLLPSSEGVRVKFLGEKTTVIDGPFAETKELIAGFWLLEVKSKEEAIEWVKCCPNPRGIDWEIEIRQVSGCRDRHAESRNRVPGGIGPLVQAPNCIRKIKSESCRSSCTSFDLSVEFGPGGTGPTVDFRGKLNLQPPATLEERLQCNFSLTCSSKAAVKRRSSFTARRLAPRC